jgi:hypothetical protein
MSAVLTSVLTMSSPNPLDPELAYFNDHRAEWLSHYAGKFALVKDETLVGTFTTFNEAYAAAVEKFGKGPFLIRQVLARDPEQSTPALFVGALFANPS